MEKGNVSPLARRVPPPPEARRLGASPPNPIFFLLPGNGASHRPFPAAQRDRIFDLDEKEGYPVS
jgi:hypothetical protein